jgi:hypothetical protein
MKVDYRLTGGGWAECEVEVAGRRAEMIASYLTDALGDLLAATLGVLTRDAERTFFFDEEPAQVHWFLRREGDEQLRVRIVRVDPNHADDEPPAAVLLDGRCRLRTFAGQVLASARRIHAAHGEKRYRKDWRMDFPLAAVAALDARLRE